MSIRSVGIIGHGSFGQFVEELVAQHLPEAEVRICSLHETPDGSRFFTLKETCVSDVVLIASSIRDFEKTLREALPLIPDTSILVEVNTVKVMPVNLLRAHAVGKQYLATHPMFGPYSFEKQGRKLDGLRLVVSEHTLPPDSYEKVLTAVRSLGLAVIEADADTHDKQLAETLFLTHYLSQSISTAGFVRTDIDTLSFGYLMDAVESTKNDLALFKDVYEFNPYCVETIRRFKEAEAEVARMLGSQ